MADVLAEWGDFSAGHWGALGPRKAPPNAFGGVNMIVDRQGGVVPVCASRPLQFSNPDPGKVLGVFYGWGQDGRVYFVQQVSTLQQYRLRAFTPDPTAIPLPIATLTGTITATAITVPPDWVGLASNFYLTIYGDKTYDVDFGAGTFATLTGTPGDAPAGRTIALYTDRLVIGGISDARFTTHPNRIHFSGDDTNNDPTNRTVWEDLNFFDVGNDDTPIAGLYPLRDALVIMLADQQAYLLTGTLGTSGNFTLRRVYGFHRGVGAVNSFTAGHGAVDPAQTRVWLFDHAYRGPARFNAAQFARVPAFGSPHASRTAADVVEGAIVAMGGPDEFLVHGVALPRTAGAGVVDHDLELLRYSNSFAVVQRTVIAPR